MNFFEHQHQAKKNSSRLILLFTLAVIAIIVAVYFPAQYVMAKYFWKAGMIKDHPIIWSYKLFAYVAGITLAIITIASWSKIRELAEGGVVVAHMMNGRLIEPETTDFKERQLLNVVEEMAIASGIPAPNVYLLDRETTINAFAAGYTTGDAVIGVTRGTIDKLTRDELQGVIGHEFSHILNGDMRLNIRLLGMLHGILVIAIIGRALLSGTRSSSSRRREGGGGIILIGLALWLIGWIGYFFGKLIQSAVSRQREFLADASAVQFTRNADGIGCALKKIAGYMGIPATGSHLLTSRKDEISHMTFATVNFSEMFGWTSSHPPIEKRIQAIDRSFNPTREKKIDALPNVITQAAFAEDEVPRHIQVDDKFIPVNQNIRYTSGGIAGLVGTIPQQAIDHQRAWLASLPQAVTNACHNCVRARSVIYILLGEYNDSIRPQLKDFLNLRDAHAVEAFNELWEPIKTLGPDSRLRLIDMCIPALRKLSDDEYKLFIQNLIDLIKMDQKVSLFEFLLMKLVKKHLYNHKHPPQKPQGKIDRMSSIESELIVLLSIMAETADASTQEAFDAGAKPLFPNSSAQLLSGVSTSQLDEALKKLSHTTYPIRQQVLEACARTALFDQKASWKEKEMLRAIGDSLNCPIPALN